MRHVFFSVNSPNGQCIAAAVYGQDAQFTATPWNTTTLSPFAIFMYIKYNMLT